MDVSVKQADYYAATATAYDAMHVDDFDEHGMALAMLAGFARHIGVTSILDVGAGTGRALKLLQAYLPEVRIVGVEPVSALREVGHASGIGRDNLVEGSGYALPFEDNSFDLVIETGVLHHLAEPAIAVREMCRVAKRGVMISDSNNFGQGSFAARLVKNLLGRLGLWRAFIWMTTRGKMSKFSEGDGLFYSYCLFDSLKHISGKFPRQFIVNTSPLRGYNLRFGTASAAILAIRDEGDQCT